MLDFIFKQSRFLLFGLLTAFFASYGQTFFISLFNFQIRDSLNITNASFGLIYSAATILSSILLIWFGKLIDKIDLLISENVTIKVIRSTIQSLLNNPNTKK